MTGGLEDAVFEEAVLAQLQDLAVAERDRTAALAELRVGPFAAYTMIGALQLACRHPDMTPAQYGLIRKVCRPLEQLFGGVLAESVQRGWDPDYDREPE